uniref:Secreted protein n=1 Tax=Strongyloides stercoralis TaxID=6248 RepID=A0A0K0EIM5_STRER
MHFIAYCSIFLIFLSQFSLQKVEAYENLQDQVDSLLKMAKDLEDKTKTFQTVKPRRTKRDFYETFGHDNWERKTLGRKYDDIKEKLSRLDPSAFRGRV